MGMPVNAVSPRARAGRFSDLHFLIPETVETVDATKEPYATPRVRGLRHGGVDQHLLMADHVDESTAKIEIGSTGHQRFVVVESPDLGEKWRMVAAAEAFHEDGPFIHPEDFDRLNGYMKATRKIDEHSEASVLIHGLRRLVEHVGRPAGARGVRRDRRDAEAGVPRIGLHQPLRLRRPDAGRGEPARAAPALVPLARRSQRRRGADLRAPLEPAALSERRHRRVVPARGHPLRLAGRAGRHAHGDRREDLRLTHRSTLAGIEVRSTYGLQIRDDAIEAQLHRDEARVRLDGMPGIPGPVLDSGINETELGMYSEQDFRPAKWLRFVLGARFDRIDVAVSNESPVAIDKVSGYRGAQQVSPKGTMIVSPLKQWDLFANYGRGFHSNDARTLIEGTATTLIATATGYEVQGRPCARSRASRSRGSPSSWTSRPSLTIDGDTSSTAPAGPSQRYGAELTGRYNLDDHLFADMAFVASSAQYSDTYDVAHGTTWVTLAPRRTFSAGIGARQPIGEFTLIGSVHVRSMADRPATQNWNPHENCPTNCMVGSLAAPSLTATGFTMVDAEAGLRWSRFELVLLLLNVANVDWREGQFAVNSRLPQEGPNPPLGISFTPGIPRTIMADASVYW